MKKAKPVHGTGRAQCPDCKECFTYPLGYKDLIIGDYGRFKVENGEYIFKRFHTCKSQSILERFKKD